MLTKIEEWPYPIIYNQNIFIKYSSAYFLFSCTSFLINVMTPINNYS